MNLFQKLFDDYAPKGLENYFQYEILSTNKKKIIYNPKKPVFSYKKKAHNKIQQQRTATTKKPKTRTTKFKLLILLIFFCFTTQL
ncbi:MAG: hypothetical protein B0W54_07490 [Cellvibrio sp. 79]|nr:MAG: hypothetical protein B0W54_07490 [Cellvibrio sp. 79]